MSGGLACATVEPSVNSTIEWIIDCGWTTTSIRSNPMSNSRWASITSRPLFTSVAEFTVMTGPMLQVGWLSAISGVTSVSSERFLPRKGPPLAVTTSRRTATGSAPPGPAAHRHWASAECSESTGIICSGPAKRLTSGPPTISDSLLASASTRPASSAASVEVSPRAPVMPLSTMSQGDAAISATPPGPASTRARAPAAARASRSAGTAEGSATATASTSKSAACFARRSTRPPPAASAVTRNRPGALATTSRAWVPMEPVEPSTTTDRGCGRDWELIPSLSPRRSAGPQRHAAVRGGAAEGAGAASKDAGEKQAHICPNLRITVSADREKSS